MGKKTKTELEEELAAAKQRIAELEFRLCNEEADEMFDIAFKRNPLPMWIYDVETLGFLEINNAACLRYGYSRDEFLNMTLLEIRPAEDKDRLVQNVRENKDIYQRSAAWRHKEKGGKIFPVEIISYSVEYRGKDARLVAALDISERKHAEDELRTSEQNYRTLVENSESAIAVINKDGKILYTNPKGMQVWNDSQIVGKTIFDVYPPEYAERYFKAINKVITTQTGLLDDVKTPIKDHLMWFRVSMQPLQNPDGTVDRLLLNAIDITQSKQAQDELRASEERLSSFFENAGSIVWIKDLEGRFIAVNKYAEAVLGWPRERILGRTVYDLFPPEEATSYAENDRKVLSSGQVVECEEEALLGGVLRIYSVTKFPLRDSNGDIYALGAISMDMTEQKQIESALRESEEKFRSLAEELEQRVIDRTNEIKSIQRRLEVATKAAELGIWDWNVNTNQLLFDEQMHVIYGTSAKTFNGTIEGFMKIVHPEDAGSLMSLAQSVLNGETHYHTQYRIIHSDRSIRHIKAYGTVLYDRQDLPEHIIGVVMDMTQDKVVEETLRLANLELERAMRVKDEFLANMSHELRTPLNSILGISESLEEQVAGQVNEKQKKYLRIISESGRHLLELINDILDLSKIGAGRLELTISQFSAEAACQSSLRIIKELAKKKSLNVSFRLDEKVEYIQGDERRLKQILVNLLSNAVKFTPEGKKLGLEVSGDLERKQVTFT
ncbi:MAG: PAS domain S-box protein, partial [Chloroflexi bacterium]|nr:PAS domain S-box protein [Chloroflexota bacterium]